ncbi:hypothetical protein BJX70DRAFT_316613 [Aspergillus crustosus]
MDDVPQKRPQPDESQSHHSRSIILPKRPRDDQSTEPAVTGDNGGRNFLATSAVNANASIDGDDDDDDDDDDDHDYTSSSGSSISSSDDEDEDEDDNHSENAENPTSGLNGDNEEITSLPTRRKPHIRRLDKEPGLLSRLSAFLPQMKTANEDLQKEIDAGRAKDIRLDEEEESHGDGQYIEMNLGLGVLEEKRSGDDENPDDGESKDPEPRRPETNVLDHLMGKEESSPSDKPSIQDLGN